MVTMRPHTPDPYPDRSRRHPGARPNEALDQLLVRTFTSRSSASRLVVQQMLTRRGWMLATDLAGRHPVPFAANWTSAARSCAGHTINARTPVAPNRHRLTPPATDRANHDHDQQPGGAR